MDNIKVSVILPVYNCETYISTALDSILNQNFEDYEIIVVDDGSTDNSLKIIKDKLLNSKIPNKIIHQTNQGASNARNRAINESSGEYIVFVDGDDYILTNHLSELYNPEYDFSLIQLVKKDGETLTTPHYYHDSDMTTHDFIKSELLMEIPFNFVQLSYKRDLIKDLKFSQNARYGEDTEFALKALSLGKSIKISNEITYYYMQHSDSMSNILKLNRFEFIERLENLREFYENKNLKELANLITTSRIPKAIFGNMNYFFYYDYDYDKVIAKMHELDLFDKLSKYNGDKKFRFKIKLFLLNPKMYYRFWKKFKNSI